MVELLPFCLGLILMLAVAAILHQVTGVSFDGLRVFWILLGGAAFGLLVGPRMRWALHAAVPFTFRCPCCKTYPTTYEVHTEGDEETVLSRVYYCTKCRARLKVLGRWNLHKDPRIFQYDWPGFIDVECADGSTKCLALAWPYFFPIWRERKGPPSEDVA